jgi:signal transduction histidine kinase
LNLSKKALKLKTEDLTSKTEELASKTEELNELNKALATANQQLELKTSEQNASNKALFDSNHKLAEVNKEIAETNKRIALTNKKIVELSKELTAVNKELALAYQTIEQQNKIHIEFINIAAHELRTPIQPILGTAELLKNEIEQANYNDRQDSKNDDIQFEQIKNRLEVIIRNAKRLKELASNILDVSRIESQLLLLNKEQFNLEELISSIISEYNESSQKGKNLLVEFKGDRNIIVKADKDRIAQVISNLLNNAVKFTKDDEPEGIISICCQRKEEDDEEDDDNNNNYVLVRVKDTGKGIDPKIFPRLFSKFITATTSTTSSTTSKFSNDGIGIGLFVSKAIIEAHGGKIWAENNSDGKGATFAFSLPVN